MGTSSIDMKLAILALALVAAANAIGLNPDNFDEVTSGKSVFIKFLAPWGGHCKSMKPAWDQLMEEFKDSKTAVVADVDCTVHQDLCGKHGVQGYPTIKYGDPNNLEDYQGGRSYDDLSAFAKENLGPSCGPANLDLCDAEQKAKVEEAMALSDADLASKIAEGEKALEDAESNFKSEVEKLQAKYESLQKEKDETIANVKKSGLGMLKSVKAHKSKQIIHSKIGRRRGRRCRLGLPPVRNAPWIHYRNDGAAVKRKLAVSDWYSVSTLLCCPKQRRLNQPVQFMDTCVDGFENGKFVRVVWS